MKVTRHVTTIRDLKLSGGLNMPVVLGDETSW